MAIFVVINVEFESGEKDSVSFIDVATSLDIALNIAKKDMEKINSENEEYDYFYFSDWNPVIQENTVNDSNKKHVYSYDMTYRALHRRYAGEYVIVEVEPKNV